MVFPRRSSVMCHVVISRLCVPVYVRVYTFVSVYSLSILSSCLSFSLARSRPCLGYFIYLSILYGPCPLFSSPPSPGIESR